MNKKLISTLFILISVLTIGLAQNITLKGVVKSKQTQQGLKDVNISIPKLQKGCVTDAQGKFSIVLPKGEYEMQVTSVGYESKVLTFNTQNPQNIKQIFLDELVTGLDEVNIMGTRKQLKNEGRTTTKINAPLKDIPMTVSSLDKKIIEQTQVNNINDALRYATGIKPTLNYGGFQTFKLRGFGGPVIMVDGARDERMNFSNSAPITSLAAVERIEYLKGPASALYGHSAIGGILNIIRKKPTKDFTINFSTYYGSWNNRGATMGAGGKLSQNLTYRFDIGLGETEGWRDYAQKHSNAYGALNYSIDKNNEIEIRIGGNNDSYDTETGFPLITRPIFDKTGKQIYKKDDFIKGYNKEQRYNDPNTDFLDHQNVNSSFKYIHTFKNNSQLSLNTSFTYDYIDYFGNERLSFPESKENIYDTYYVNSDNQKVYIDLNHFLRDYYYRFSHETKTFQNYLEYTKTFNTGSITHNILAGYFFMNLNRTSRTGYNADDLIRDEKNKGKEDKVTVVNPILNQGYLSSKFSEASIYREIINGVYLHDLINISPKLKALLAVRFDYYMLKNRTGKIKEGRRVINKGPYNKITNTPVSYRLGIVYQPIKPLSLYTSYATLFKPNRIAYINNAVYLNSAGNRFYPHDGKEVFKPQDGNQIEVGIKYSPMENLQINVASYHINLNNIASFVGNLIEDKPTYAQIGQAYSKGLEIDINYAPIKGLNITTGYSFCEAKYKGYSSKSLKLASKKGNYLRRNPKNQFFLWSHYAVPKGVLKNFNIGLGVNYTDEMYTNYSGINNDFKIPSYWLTEAAIGYEINNLSFRLKINNLLDNDYFYNSVGDHQFLPGAERNFLFTVGYKI